jgi:hypothetical protein
MASILPFIRKRCDFDDGWTELMGKAFDAACHELHDKGQPLIVQEVIAKRIIRAARLGEMDPKRLRDAALSAIGPKTSQLSGPRPKGSTANQ